jgi:hypothetical protein
MELAVVTCCCNDCKYNAVKQSLSKSQQNTVIFGGSGNRECFCMQIGKMETKMIVILKKMD